jgi:AAA domain
VVEALTAALRDRAFDVLVVDPFVSVHQCAENDNNAIDLVAKTFGRIAGAAKCAVELVHHTRKTGGQEITAEDGRGASALGFAARLVRVLNPMSKDEAEKSGVGERRGFYFRSDNGKANLVPPSTKATWYELRSIPLGNGDELGVVTPWQWPDAFAGVTVTDLRAVQARVAQGRWRENCRAANWIGNAVAEVLKLNPKNKGQRAKINAMLQVWIKNGMFVIVEGKDERRETRSFVEVGEPAND